MSDTGKCVSLVTQIGSIHGVQSCVCVCACSCVCVCACSCVCVHSRMKPLPGIHKLFSAAYSGIRGTYFLFVLCKLTINILSNIAKGGSLFI